VKWKRKPDPLDRLMANVDKADCWTFRGALRNGYGALGIDGRTVYAHRYAYERLVGPIPDGLVIDHLCRNRACCNPAHLEPVRQQINCQRGERAGERVTECKRGHAYTPENTYRNPQGYRACRTCKQRQGEAL
jgi:hypothetical protein